MARKRTWTCRRATNGVLCGHKNRAALTYCAACGKKRPPRRKPQRLEGLEAYEVHLAINGGSPDCGICGRAPDPTRLNDRDHDHTTHRPRGLLCPRCNRILGPQYKRDWLRAAAAYLERTS